MENNYRSESSRSAPESLNKNSGLIWLETRNTLLHLFRVGAADYQFKGISTFMAEMCDCVTTLEIATENSFISYKELVAMMYLDWLGRSLSKS
uniref:Uncharacterized protein n=1 Tax=Ditylenchus dipsaci TaxID=166011 RepID=A0A915EFI2_9BILA